MQHMFKGLFDGTMECDGDGRLRICLANCMRRNCTCFLVRSGNIKIPGRSLSLLFHGFCAISGSERVDGNNSKLNLTDYGLVVRRRNNRVRTFRSGRKKLKVHFSLPLSM